MCGQLLSFKQFATGKNAYKRVQNLAEVFSRDYFL